CSSCAGSHSHLPSFPTRCSSDLWRSPVEHRLEQPIPAQRLRRHPLQQLGTAVSVVVFIFLGHKSDCSHCCCHRCRCFFAVEALGDRKSTRLNSSHVKISYAVFCL